MHLIIVDFSGSEINDGSGYRRECDRVHFESAESKEPPIGNGQKWTQALRSTSGEAEPVRHAHTCTCIHTCSHAYVNIVIHKTYIHTYIHTYSHSYIHTHTHTHTYIYIYRNNISVHTYIHTYGNLL